MMERFNCKINVQIRPKQVTFMQELNIENMIDGSISEPRKLVKRYENFLITEQQPKAVSGDICYLSCQSACAKPF